MKDFGIFRKTFQSKTLDSMILPKRIKSIFETDLEYPIKQHYLFYSTSPGTGKSTLCDILTQNYETKKINLSETRGIEVVRTIFKNFATSNVIFNGKYKQKVIWLDELDGATSEFFDALRGSLEKYENNLKFIATCNDINKIPAPIAGSRFQIIPFDAQTDEERKEIKLHIIMFAKSFVLCFYDTLCTIF
jgi:DNA polymerase III delta prime subunit